MNEQTVQDWIAKLKLVRILSLAVLRLHSTPWLPGVWTSSDVHLLDDQSADISTPTLNHPYVETRVATTSSTTPIIPRTLHASCLAANAALFNLGIILIELANDAPFQSLYDRSRGAEDILNQVTDFVAARRLGEAVHKRLNITYGRLVERCLNCNFGVATKLDDPELQSAVCIHV